MPTAQDRSQLRDLAVFLRDDLQASGIDPRSIIDATGIDAGNWVARIQALIADRDWADGQIDLAGTWSQWSTEADGLRGRLTVALPARTLGSDTETALATKLIVRLAAYLRIVGA